MAGNCFENSTPENVDSCPNDESASGLATRVQYIPANFIEKMNLPSVEGKMRGIATIVAAGIILKADKGWKGIDVVVNENELKEVLVGGIGNQKGQVELTLMIPKFSAKTLGFKRRFANVPLVFNIPDSKGKNWIVGTKFSPAMIESAESTTGKAYEDKSTSTYTIKANCFVYLFEGEVKETPDTPVVITP